MPEFVMPVGDYIKTFNDLTEFQKGYVEAMFFTECHSDNPELEDGTFSDLDTSAIKRVIVACNEFEKENGILLEKAYDHEEVYYDAQRAGNDFWYTRNGHGTGFWDRDLGEIGVALTKAAKKYSNLNLYRGDDGRIYLDIE